MTAIGSISCRCRNVERRGRVEQVQADAVELLVSQKQLGGARARRQTIDFGVGGVGDIERLVRADAEIVASRIIARQSPRFSGPDRQRAIAYPRDILLYITH